MKNLKSKSVIKERIKGKTIIIEKEMEGGTRKIFHSGTWKCEEVMHGKYEEYYEPLEFMYMPKIICSYKYGVYHGKYESWFEEGYKAEEGRYINGKKNGKWKTWFYDGGIESIIHYKDGKKDGVFIEYYQEGGKARESIYKNNKIIKETGEWEYDEMKDYQPPRDSDFI